VNLHSVESGYLYGLTVSRFWYSLIVRAVILYVKQYRDIE
jgi:hypothetical protein